MTAIPRAKIRLPLLAIVAAAAGLIIARMIWPKLHFDTTSLILFGIAAVAWALAYVPVTKLKFGDFEAELAPLVAAVEQQVLAAEAAATVRSAQGPEGRPGVVYRGGPAEEREDAAARAALEEYAAIVGSGASDRDKIIRVANLVERVAQGEKHAEVRQAGESFAVLRNHIVHGGAVPSPEYVSAVLDAGGRLIKAVAR